MTLSDSPPDWFDPDFDDRAWTDEWLVLPVAPVPPGTHPSGYRVVRQLIQAVPIFGQIYRLSAPLDCRLLLDPDDRLWMSDTPQERIMMINNAGRTQGHVLIGGLGLGLYPQYAAASSVGGATRFTVIEESAIVRDIVEPTLSTALDVPLEIHLGDVAAALRGPAKTHYDTIFLDVWETLDAAYLPFVNGLRDDARRHLAPGGRVLLWGYGWMLSLFEDACRQLLALPRADRPRRLRDQAAESPRALDLLMPVVAHFEETPQNEEDLDAALAWCREYAVQLQPKR